MRKPFQGVLNIIRFNWPYYVFAFLSVIVIYFARNAISQPLFLIAANTVLAVICLTTMASLLVSWYVYDLSGLYSLKWLDVLQTGNGRLLNINAGFDEFSGLIGAKFPASNLTVCDFYDDRIHTEPSIKRARKMYPSKTGIIKIETKRLPFGAAAFDRIFLFFAAHEIRNEKERIEFFTEIRRVATGAGEIVVMEHLRDVPNFFAYNIGFLHFFSNNSWMKCFTQSGLRLVSKSSITPFVTIYTLSPNGNTH